jgi:EmrB/QacA subfamily drug resistance transporter
MRSSATRSSNYKYWGFGAIAIGSFANVMDHGSVNVALPSIATNFGSDLPTVQWVVIGYLLTISALLLPMGRLADLVGRKEVYIAGSLIFIFGAVLAGFSPNLTILVLSRILQGVGAAMTQGTGMAIITSMFPSHERGKALGLIMTVVGTGAVAGPAVGGFLVNALEWRWVFFFNAPLGLLGVLASIVVLDAQSSRPARDESRQRGFDWIGAILSTAALVIFLLALMNVHRFGLDSTLILTGFLCFFVLLGAFIWWELRTSMPLLDVRLFQSKTFSFGTCAALLIFLGSSAILFLTPFYLQRVLGYSAMDAGLIVVPGALFMAVLGPISGELSDRFGPRPFTVGGLALTAAGLFMLSGLTETSSIRLILPALILTSAGMGTFYSANTSSILSAVQIERYGVVSAFLNLTRNAANVTSIAVATAIVTGTMGSMGHEPSLAAVQCGVDSGVCNAFTSGMRNAYRVMTVMLLLGMVVSAFKFSGVKESPPQPA